MYIRQLTDEEKSKIKAVKDKANTAIRDKRKALRKEIKCLGSPYLARGSAKQYLARELAKQLEKLKNVTGYPVVFELDGSQVILDYSKVKKLDTNLDPRTWTRQVCIRNKQLTVRYHKNFHKGVLTLNELPEYQTSLLQDLPIVKIEEEYQWPENRKRLQHIPNWNKPGNEIVADPAAREAFQALHQMMMR